MSLATTTIPQADQLWDVARVPEAIDRGWRTNEAIAEYIGMKVARQGQYYTQAARILGLVATGEPGDELTLTILGRGFARSNRVEQRTYLRRLLLQREPTRTVVLAMRIANGLDRRGIAQTLQTLAPLADSTAHRRAFTVAAWLSAVGLAEWRNGQLFYTGPNFPLINAAQDRDAA
ncbi:DUF7226 domain-containing protein [Candidatus Viridilinea mediisalina]|uniref:DUF7226 domain-containing protein n=1 Tax=Candidatus Viridilinea mediisalina TaxID=2024553 RepID=A0A2A6RLS2_9CHLR|nr:hypothetical protein [Candidatus Viridilinea mediisalina]PDW03808.1 hypothetical protein CJ255_07065 [Candidatus Viridilinea mediisalina]